MLTLHRTSVYEKVPCVQPKLAGKLWKLPVGRFGLREKMGGTDSELVSQALKCKVSYSLATVLGTSPGCDPGLGN